MFRLTLKAALACLVCVVSALPVAQSHAQATNATLPSDHGVYPPWQHEANNDRAKLGLQFTEPDADNLVLER